MRLLPNSIHVFEALDKENLTSKKRVSKGRRKRIARTPWRRIHKRVSEVALIELRKSRAHFPGVP